MIRKTDKIEKRTAWEWVRGHTDRGRLHETFRRETWWLLWVIPIYSRDTILSRSA